MNFVLSHISRNRAKLITLPKTFVISSFHSPYPSPVTLFRQLNNLFFILSLLIINFVRESRKAKSKLCLVPRRQNYNIPGRIASGVTELNFRVNRCRISNHVSYNNREHSTTTEHKYTRVAIWPPTLPLPPLSITHPPTYGHHIRFDFARLAETEADAKAHLYSTPLFPYYRYNNRIHKSQNCIQVLWLITTLNVCRFQGPFREYVKIS